MGVQFNITQEESTRAKWPHEIFLINLVFNHIFVFVATLAVYKNFPLLPLIVPILSFSIMGYILFKAKQVANSDETGFVKANWEIAAKRNRFFMLLLAITLTVSGGGILLSQFMHWNPIMTKALIGGVGLLPFMVALLVLIVLGNESQHLSKAGKLPKKYAEKFNQVESANT